MAQDSSSTGKYLALRLAYRGDLFQGSQFQARAKSVQGEVEAALQTLTRKSHRLHSVSRTDAGVHALDAVFFVKSIDPMSEVDSFRFYGSLNALLRPAIRVVSIGALPQSFSPLRHVRWKEYRYYILQSLHPDPFMDDRSWRLPSELSESQMRKELKKLEGVHDFAAFAKSSGKAVRLRKKGSVRELIQTELRVTKHNYLPDAKIYEFRIRGRAFLHHMVRNIVGSLVEIGAGAPLRVEEILERRSRQLAGRTAPAKGLFLYKTKLEPRIYTELQPKKPH